MMWLCEGCIGLNMLDVAYRWDVVAMLGMYWFKHAGCGYVVVILGMKWFKHVGCGDDVAM